MADTKISALTALVGVDVSTANDVLPIVDTSVTTTKKITIAELIIALGSSMTTGDVKFTIKTTADTGWVLCNDGTIGNAASGGTTRANADTESLFTLLWTNVSDTYAAVSSGRGASAAADFAANKTIALTKMLGRSLAVYGAGSGLTSREMGQTVGVETHTLVTGEIPAHSHLISSLGNAVGSGSIPSGNSFSGSKSTDNTGGGGAHQNMQPTSFLNAMIKL